MGQRTDRNKIDAGFCDRANGGESYPAGSLRLEHPVIGRDCFAQFLQIEIIEHHTINNTRTEPQDLLELLDRGHLDLDGHLLMCWFGRVFAYALDDLLNITTIGCNVIVLDKDHLAKRVSMIRPAANANGVTIERP